MGLKLKYFTIEEAEALLPKIKEILHLARDTKALIEKKVEEWRRAHPHIKPADEAVMRGQVDFLAAQLENQLDQITELGCIPKDLDLGLVDFPARMEDREGYYCWKWGEGKIQYWHNLTEGFTGRKPINVHH
jgi:hypothetical protein